ncbi:DNA cytosine methyltransferase [Rhizobium leguminosarum]|uniref:DNA cytosine methyltransferase n=1 Tax=Rhizobium leguminosarum TaxID=384 RepID=UPI0031B9F7A9
MKQLGLSTELIVDSFAGGGGASTGIEKALGHPVHIAINHDPEAVALHDTNHPYTKHFCEDIWEVDPRKVDPERPIGLLWASPDCKHFSKAKGGAPVSKRVRGLAWIVMRWAALRKPRVIMLENVEEFTTWGPIDADGKPRSNLRGITFKSFVHQLRHEHGYTVEWKELRACDYGAPTIRKRLFLIARRDGLPIVWPKPTHGKPGSGLLPYRTAADIIDWSIPCPSIFERSKPLAENTERRIAKGILKYVVNNPKPFLVEIANASGGARANGVEEPLRTITAFPKGGSFAVVDPFIVKVNHGYDRFRGQSVHEPIQTLTAKHGFALCAPIIERSFSKSEGNAANAPIGTITAGGGGKAALVCPTLVQVGYGERKALYQCGECNEKFRDEHATGVDTLAPAECPCCGEEKNIQQVEKAQHARVPGLDKPLGTVVASGQKHALVSAFLAKHYGGVVGTSVDVPTGTVTTSDHHSLVTAHVMKMRGENVGHAANEPLHTISAGGTHFAEVRAFLIKYFGTDQDPRLDEPLHTVTTKDRFGLVTIHGEDYQIVDIGMRMLSPRELYRAQGFPDDYIIDRTADGKPLSKVAQVRMCGNSVSPVMSEVLVRANMAESVLYDRRAA